MTGDRGRWPVTSRTLHLGLRGRFFGTSRTGTAPKALLRLRKRPPLTVLKSESNSLTGGSAPADDVGTSPARFRRPLPSSEAAWTLNDQRTPARALNRSLAWSEGSRPGRVGRCVQGPLRLGDEGRARGVDQHREATPCGVGSCSSAFGQRVSPPRTPRATAAVAALAALAGRTARAAMSDGAFMAAACSLTDAVAPSARIYTGIAPKALSQAIMRRASRPEFSSQGGHGGQVSQGSHVSKGSHAGQGSHVRHDSHGGRERQVCRDHSRLSLAGALRLRGHRPRGCSRRPHSKD